MTTFIPASLKKLLANTYLLAIQTQGAHWNIEGSDFQQLHTLFQTQYQELNAAVDVIAEHIRTYGSYAPGSAKEFVKLATFEELNYAKRPVVNVLLSLIAEHRACIDVATALGNKTTKVIHTQNLMAERIAAHGKAIWMLDATLMRKNNPWA